MITIVTDSSSYLTQAEAAALGVVMVPMSYSIGRAVYPEAFVDKGESTRKFEKVRAASIAWSEGDPRRAGRRDNPIVVWQ